MKTRHIKVDFTDEEYQEIKVRVIQEKSTLGQWIRATLLRRLKISKPSMGRN